MKLFVLLALFAVGTFAQQSVHPCFSRNGGFAPVLNECRAFWRCEDSPPSRGVCDSDRVFNDQTQGCAPLEWTRCYRCTEVTSFRQSSIFGACRQFARCFRGRPDLFSCPEGLVFDGRAHIRNCNYPPPVGRCFASDDDFDRDLEEEYDPQGEVLECPGAETVNPLYIRARNSCQRYRTFDW